MTAPASAFVVTLFEGAYHLGLGVLVNSLVRNGLKGRIIAGFRGPLPPWCSQLHQLEAAPQATFRITQDCTLTFVPLVTTIHLTNYKPAFVLNAIETFGGHSSNVFYFDPDIIVQCRWSFFEEWVTGGVALCEDVNWRMPNGHPVRNAWRNYFGRLGITLGNSLDAYYNAGFVGAAPGSLDFFRDWCCALDACDFDRQVLVGNDRTHLFKGVDQDALNIATMRSSVPLSTIGPEGMDFRSSGGGFVMSHAIGSLKPWNHSYSWATVALGRRLTRAERLFLDYADTPIRVLSRPRLLAKKLDRFVAAALARVL